MWPDKKILLFTFDYELFLGNRSGTVQECLIKPTNQLLSLFGKNKFKAVFFIDTVYLMRLKEITSDNIKAADDLLAITEQLKIVVEQGHYIFPHIHPHWLDAVYLPELNEWSLANTRYYQFSSLSSEFRKDLFETSIKIIHSIANSVVKDYKVDVYRAGGWSIQPFECFRPYFLQYGIYHEMSVIPGKYLVSDTHNFDFRRASLDNPIYNFSDDICLEDKSGQFKEWTISTIAFTRFEKWVDFKINGLTQRIKGKENKKGQTVTSNVLIQEDIYCKKYGNRIVASFEGLNFFRAKKVVDEIKSVNYFHFISHPKLITDREFNEAKELFFTIKKNFEIETDFRRVSLND